MYDHMTEMLVNNTTEEDAVTPLKYFTLQTLCSGSILYLRDNISTRLSVSWADYKSRNRSQKLSCISSDFEPTSISNRTLYSKISLIIKSTIILGGRFRIQFTYYIWYSVTENI